MICIVFLTCNFLVLLLQFSSTLFCTFFFSCYYHSPSIRITIIGGVVVVDVGRIHVIDIAVDLFEQLVCFESLLVYSTKTNRVFRLHSLIQEDARSPLMGCYISIQSRISFL